MYCCNTPKYFYVDEDRECIQCGRTFVFRAKEQKYWYEVLQFTLTSVPVRCTDCRRQRRSEHAMREAIAMARRDVAQKDPGAYLALARAIIEYHERTQQGNLDDAIDAARKASAIMKDSSEPYLWEGIAHAIAGHRTKADAALRHFLDGQKPWEF
jgi:Flp pilus assembly protein TadD